PCASPCPYTTLFRSRRSSRVLPSASESPTMSASCCSSGYGPDLRVTTGSASASAVGSESVRAPDTCRVRSSRWRISPGPSAGKSASSPYARWSTDSRSRTATPWPIRRPSTCIAICRSWRRRAEKRGGFFRPPPALLGYPGSVGRRYVGRMVLRLSERPERDRPRERLWSVGPSALTGQELLAVLLGTGCAGQDALAVAGAVLARVDGSLRRLAGRPSAELALVPGVGRSQAARVAAAVELGRRVGAG